MGARISVLAAFALLALAPAAQAAAPYKTPTLDFAASQPVPQRLTLSFSTTLGPDDNTANAATVYWDLDGDCDGNTEDPGVDDDGDGKTGERIHSGKTLDYTYPAAGRYPICAQAWAYDSTSDGGSDLSSRCRAANGGETDPADETPATGDCRHTVTVNRAPIASFEYSPAVPQATSPVTFTSNSTDGDGHALTFAWELDGDGDYNDAATATATHTYGAAGTYTVGLRVTDELGGVSEQPATLEVAPAPSSGGDGGPSGGTGGSAGGEPGGAFTDSGTLAGVQVGGRPGWLLPFPVVRIAGRTNPRGARFTVFSVRAPRGSTVLVRCAGRGCPLKSKRLVVGKSKRLRVRKLQRQLRAGIVISVRVSKPGLIGKFTRFRVRKIKAPVRYEACLMPGKARPAACPKR